MSQDLTILPTGAALGAEVHGLDLRDELEAGVVARLRAAFLEHAVLVFRGQQISEADHVRFSRHFGKPVPHVREQADRPIKEIFIISNVTEDGRPIGALGNEELLFHSDLSYLPTPGSISMLHAIEVPARGGDTTWASGYASYEALAEPVKRRVASLRAVHRHPRPQQNPPAPAVHPVVRPHAETGRPVLYVSPQFTSRIEGLGDDESQALLAELLAHATHPRFAWTHRWRVGDLVMWDNRCTMHRRDGFDASERRLMKRTQMLEDPR